MNYDQHLDVKNEERVCAFCGGKVTKRENGTWKCKNCGFWYEKLMNKKKGIRK